MVLANAAAPAGKGGDVVMGWFEFLDKCRQDRGYAHSETAARDRQELAERWGLECPGLALPSLEWSDVHGQYMLFGLNVPTKP